MRIGADGRRYFGDNCDGGHRVSDRHEEHSGLLEWTGTVWAPVCPTDDVPMTGRDASGMLCCGVCGAGR